MPGWQTYQRLPSRHSAVRGLKARCSAVELELAEPTHPERWGKLGLVDATQDALDPHGIAGELVRYVPARLNEIP